MPQRERRVMIGIGLFGASGRMGEAIAKLVAGREDMRVVDSGADAPQVFIDFSAPEALGPHLATATAAQRPIVIGTTGLTDQHHRQIDEAARTIAVLQAANTSLGVNLLAFLVREAAARLGPEWDIEIIEMHHRHKVDAPSGTALLLGQAAAEGRGVELAQFSDRGRDGITGPRPAGHIGFASLRGGSVAGDHHVYFAGESERIELGHRAESREIFAQGALRAAEWLIGKPAGRYTMADVLGLE
jgi:4-hydroxy-tetrahydrodipicolinate reductase